MVVQWATNFETDLSSPVYNRMLKEIKNPHKHTSLKTDIQKSPCTPDPLHWYLHFYNEISIFEHIFPNYHAGRRFQEVGFFKFRLFILEAFPEGISCQIFHLGIRCDSK